MASLNIIWGFSYMARGKDPEQLNRHPEQLNRHPELVSGSQIPGQARDDEEGKVRDDEGGKVRDDGVN